MIFRSNSFIEIKPQLLAVLEKYKEIEQAERDKKKKEQDALKISNENKNPEGIILSYFEIIYGIRDFHR